MKKILSLIALMAALVTGMSLRAEEPDSAEFLRMVRSPRRMSTWARMEGKAIHERKKAPASESPISFSIRFTPEHTFARLLIGENEMYNIGQSYFSEKQTVTVIPAAEYKSPILDNYGLRPDDLTMSFLFWDLQEELPRDSFAAQSCRVFILKSAEKNETVKVFISDKHLFPLKAEWTRDGESRPYRSMEVNSFKKVNELWVINALLLLGPGWRTKIEFSSSDANLTENGMPEDLFPLQKEEAEKAE